MIDLETSTDLCRLLSDSSRLRLMSLLAEEELTVAELTQVTRLPQSRTSSHLGRLRDAGLVVDRRAGKSSFYRLNSDGMTEECRLLWRVLRERTHDPLLEEDAERLREVLGARTAGTTWADSVAGQMERHYSPGRTWASTSTSLVGLLDLGRVLDIASGDGAIAEFLAGRTQSLTCVDISRRVVEAGSRRLSHLPQVRFHRCDMHQLPFGSESFDQVLLMNALTHTEEPDLVLSEAARVLVRGGALSGCTLAKHQHRVALDMYSHKTFGFVPEELEARLASHGFEVQLCRITSVEKRRPHFQVITFHARRALRP